MKNVLETHLEESFLVQENMLLDNSLFVNFTNLVSLVEAVIANNKKIYLIGNYPDTARLAALLPTHSISLNTDTSRAFDVINNFSVEQFYSKQIDALVKDGDIVIAFASGPSVSIFEGLGANLKKSYNILFSGASPGKLAKYADLVFSIPSENEGRIREGHQLIYNALVGALNGKS